MQKVNYLNTTCTRDTKEQETKQPLLQEIFDEEEQARLFKQAVEEFRRGKAQESATIPETNYLPINKKRDCCWTCFKVILEENSLQEIFEDKIMKVKVVIFLMT
jgi:hypothetical protein